MADETEKVTGDAGQQAGTDAPETTENGESGESTGDGEKKDRKPAKTAFNIAGAKQIDGEGNIVTAVNGDGLLIAVPVPIRDTADKTNLLYEGWNARKHAPLKKNDFIDEVAYIRYQAFALKVRAAIMIQSAEQKEERANQLAQFGSEAARKKVAKLLAMKKAMADIQKQLEDEGIDISAVSAPAPEPTA